MTQLGDPALIVPDELEPIDTSVLGRSPWQLFWRRFRTDKWALAGAVFIGFIFFLAFLGGPIASALTGHDVNEKFIKVMTDEYGAPKGPTLSSEVGVFLLGADDLGRDLLVRIMYGLRPTLIVAISATIIEVVIGVTLGMIAGFFGGKADTLISRSAEIVLTLPVTMLALGLGAACFDGCLGGLIEPGIPLVTFILAVFSWPYILRVVRGQVLSLREQEFVQASRSLGAPSRRIIMREIFSNVLGYVLVYSMLIIPVNILFEAGLSFLGVGLPPQTPSWGRLIDEGAGLFRSSPWLILFPGLFLMAVTIAFNLVGEGMRDALDPRRSVGSE